MEGDLWAAHGLHGPGSSGARPSTAQPRSCWADPQVVGPGTAWPASQTQAVPAKFSPLGTWVFNVVGGRQDILRKLTLWVCYHLS